MKQQIMEKLVNNEELSSEEIIFLSRNLSNDTGVKQIPFSHSENDIFKACGLTNSQAADFHSSLMQYAQDGMDKVSKLVEKLESVCLSNEASLRMAIVNAIKFAYEEEAKKQLPDMLRGLLGGLGSPEKGE